MKWTVALLALLLAGCAERHLTAPERRLALHRGEDYTQPLTPVPTSWDSVWVGYLAVNLDGRQGAEPCSLSIVNGTANGAVAGIPFAPAALDSLGTRDVFNVAHVTLLLADGTMASLRLERYSTANVMIASWNSYYLTSLGQQFSAYVWLCKGCTPGAG